MDFFTRFRRQLTGRIALPFIFHALLMVGVSWLAIEYIEELFVRLAVIAAAYIIGLLFAGAVILRDSLEPIKALWDTVQFISPHSSQQLSPDIDNVRVGQEMVSSLSKQIFQLASVVESVEKTTAPSSQDIHANFIANSLPLPLFVLDKNEQIIFANKTASDYFSTPSADLAGQDVNTALPMAFRSKDTFSAWMDEVKTKSATADMHWDRVRIGLLGQKDSKQFDLAAHYNRGNPLGYETILVLFDHSEVYAQDDQAISFVALTVHELRTPLTLLRGYIEVFNEEIGPKLDPELREFMVKMDASAQQLTGFVNNILNVAKIEDNQLTLKLQKDNWHDIIDSVVHDMAIRAQVRGVTLKTSIKGDIPPVGVDRYSIYEVLSNLIDNAIKYCGTAKEIHISTEVNADGMVETMVKDFGLGIDSSILPNIFDKFYRNHRNRAQVGGTGLGLFLSRAIVQAHGGQISVRSKVNAGSSFIFTVLPFDKIKDINKNENGLIRGAHGWIRNHSMYRE